MVLNFSHIDRSTLLGRTMRWPLSLIPAKTRLPIVQGPLTGYRWIVGSSNHGCWLGSYESEQQSLFKKWVKKGDIVFDIGAHVGFYTLLSSHLVGDKGRVVAFEPIPENLTYLEQHLRMNTIANVDILEVAVSNRQGHDRLSNGPSSSMWHFDAQGSLEVRTIRLDDLVLDEKLPAPSLIKMDIEGAEALALHGCAGVIDAFHPVFILSTHGPDVHQSCCRILKLAGYNLTPIGVTSIDECRELIAVHHGAH
jgi:FkbM family methyltransferase